MPVETDPERDEDQKELNGQMSFLDHLEELRKRIINTLIAVGLGFAACYAFANDIFKIVAQPILSADATLNMMSPTEGFNLEIKTAFLTSVFLTAPFILAQVWLFIAPGLYKHARRYAAPFVIFSSILFLLGGMFGYFIAFPFAIQFLLQTGREMGVVPVINASEYFNLFIAIELGLGVVFEIPAVIFILSRIGLVSAGFLLKNMKYAVLLSFVLAAVLTPSSDIPNMMVMAIPMIALYLLGIIVAFLFGKKRKKEEGD
jgi:sec-independent protein translocase protein TatC